MKRWIMMMTISMSVIALLTGCGGGKKIVATVNGKDITQDEFAKMMQNYQTGTPVRELNGGLMPQGPAGGRAIRDLISRKVIELYAAEKKISITDQDINNEIERLKKINPKLIEQITQSGQTIDDLRQIVREQITNFKILESYGVTVSDQEINDYGDQLKKTPDYMQNMFSIKGLKTPASVQLMVIATADKTKKEKAQSELSKGVDFKEVAKKYNDLKELQDRGGDYGLLPLEVIEKQFFNKNVADTLRKTAQNKTTPWFQLKNEWVIFKVVRHEAEKVKPFTEELKTDVRRFLIWKKAGEQKVVEKMQKDLNDYREKCKIDIKIEPWKTQFAEAEKKSKENKEPAPGTPQPTPGGTTGAQPNPSSGR